MMLAENELTLFTDSRVQISLNSRPILPARYFSGLTRSGMIDPTRGATDSVGASWSIACSHAKKLGLPAHVSLAGMNSLQEAAS